MSSLYIIDSNILIASNNLSYPMDIMPKFWEQLISCGAANTILIDKVRDEILRGEDDLSDWLRKNGKNFINKDANDITVIQSYSNIMQGVQNSTQYRETAKQEFASVADSWICAHALAYDYTVVTQERYSKDSKKRVLIPTVCKEYNIRCISLVDYIREIGIIIK